MLECRVRAATQRNVKGKLNDNVYNEAGRENIKFGLNKFPLPRSRNVRSLCVILCGDTVKKKNVTFYIKSY